MPIETNLKSNTSPTQQVNYSERLLQDLSLIINMAELSIYFKEHRDYAADALRWIDNIQGYYSSLRGLTPEITRAVQVIRNTLPSIRDLLEFAFITKEEEAIHKLKEAHNDLELRLGQQNEQPQTRMLQ
mgnify:CR=1 FL=1